MEFGLNNKMIWQLNIKKRKENMNVSKINWKYFIVLSCSEALLTFE